MNVNPYNTKAYGNKSNWTIGENKPKTNPISPTPIFDPKTRTLTKMNRKNLKNLPNLTFTGTFNPPIFPKAGHLFDLLWILHSQIIQFRSVFFEVV